MDQGESESVAVDESSKDERKPKSVHKSINTSKEKYAIDEKEHEGNLVTDNPVITDPGYFNLFECGKNLLNRLDTTSERACMATSWDIYYTEMFMTLTDYNDRNNKPLPNDNILESIRKFIEQESISDANNVTADTFSHTSNTQRQNANAIFTSEKLDKLDDLADTVEYLTTNDAKYYESNTVTASDAQGYPTRNPETVTHTSNGN